MEISAGTFLCHPYILMYICMHIFILNKSAGIAKSICIITVYSKQSFWGHGFCGLMCI